MRDLQSVSASEAAQGLRQLIGPRHAGPLQQHGDDPHLAIKGSLDLESHEVILILKTTAALGVDRGRPLSADEGQKHVARADRLVDHIDEVHARLDRVDVHEDLVAEMIGQRVIQPAGGVRRVLSSIADEDAKRRSSPFGPAGGHPGSLPLLGATDQSPDTCSPSGV